MNSTDVSFISLLGSSVDAFGNSTTTTPIPACLKERSIAEVESFETEKDDIKQYTPSKMISNERWTRAITEESGTKLVERQIHALKELETSFTEKVSCEIPKIHSTNFLNGKWQIREEISLKNLKVPIVRSAVKLSFCEGNFKESPGTSFALRGSVHTDLGSLCKCLDIEDNRMLVSPVPEFHVGKNVILNDYAITEIPLCVPAMSSSLKVHWMETNKNQPKTMADVPFVQCHRKTGMDTFYIIPEGRNTCVHVYTRHFSVFYCTACKEEIQFKMAAEVYAREGSIDGFPTLHVTMPLLGPYEMLEDCREERNRRMEEVNFRRIDRGKISTLKSKHSTALRFQLKHPLNWVHDKEQGEVIYEEVQLNDVISKTTGPRKILHTIRGKRVYFK
ncbi:uncharacterized protein LOC117343295 [Pecten maximus]|uniref:uncharacterized protein LOC117343295 n=1 Tax=Pecten maximus TaxID=6579 RepID=UPI001457F4C3|nr:uncharacterized protein LOC117343295 [Pecten maximus]